ncbi:MAG: phosphotransferase [Candidatus Auribacterota bacterium]
MKPEKAAIRHYTKSLFEMSRPHVELLCGDGSDRKYYRVNDRFSSVILMEYGVDKVENDYYVPIHSFLSKLNVPVPKLLHFNEDKRWVYLEDLGDVSLYEFVKCADQYTIIEIYKKVMAYAMRIWKEGHELFIKEPVITEKGFGYDLYAWEHAYFIDNYVRMYRGFDGPLPVVEDSLKRLIRKLEQYQNTLIHRDLQSKNIFIKNHEVYFIDFQGLRPGLPLYDLASLICDPYVHLDDVVRDELLNYFYTTYGTLLKFSSIKEFYELFALCTTQRLLQALGAYCFLGIKKKKTHFLQYITPAESLLKETVEKIGFLSELAKII